MLGRGLQAPLEEGVAANSVLLLGDRIRQGIGRRLDQPNQPVFVGDFLEVMLDGFPALLRVVRGQAEQLRPAECGNGGDALALQLSLVHYFFGRKWDRSTDTPPRPSSSVSVLMWMPFASSELKAQTEQNESDHDAHEDSSKRKRGWNR